MASMLTVGLLMGCFLISDVAHADVPVLTLYQGERFSLQVPQGWTVRKEKGRDAVMFSLDPTRADTPDVIVWVTPADFQTITAALAYALAGTMGGDIAPLDRNTPLRPGDPPALFERHDPPARVAVKLKQLSADDYGVLIMFAATQEEFEQYGGIALLDTVASSVRPSRPAVTDSGPDAWEAEESVNNQRREMAEPREDANKHTPQRRVRPPSNGGLVGFFAMHYLDTLGYCGGYCWEYYVFFPDGRVMTALPRGGVDHVDCKQNLTTAKGNPICSNYRVDGDMIQIGEKSPVQFSLRGDTLQVGKKTFTRVKPLTTSVLDGSYISSMYAKTSGGANTSNIGLDVGLQFRREGVFDGSRFASFFADNTGPNASSGNTSGYAKKYTAGRYHISGNTLELIRDDGEHTRLTIFIPFSETNSARPEMIHIEHRDYLLQK